MTEPVEPADPVVVEPVKNNAPTVTPPNQELEDFKRKYEQAEMRARQLENEKLAREKSDEEARNKQLEENNEFKTLYERELTARKELEETQERNERQTFIGKVNSDILASYPSEVSEAADELGLSLLDDSEDSKTAFKTKLDALKARVSITTPPKKVVGNNGQPTVVTDDEIEHQKDLVRMRVDPQAKLRYIGDLKTVNIMRQQAIGEEV